MLLGIDLGTTRTLVAVCDRGNYPVVGFDNLDGDRVDYLPTVSAERDGELVHGFVAEQVALEGGPHLRSWKRLLGRHGPDQRVQIGALDVSLLDLTTSFLVHLRQQLEGNLPKRRARPGAVTISVPANAHSSQRFITLEAFRRAGFEVAAVLNEPSAAGIEYAHRHRGTLNSKREHVAVYDLGGGTFDAALVLVTDDRHDVIDTAGVQELGGDDFDRVLCDMALERLDLDAAVVAASLPGLLEECRLAKESILPATRRLLLELDALGEARPSEPLVIEVKDYYERLRPLVERSEAALLEVMTPGQGEATSEDLKERAAEVGVAGIYVVGGASALPLVPRLLREKLGRRVHRAAQPAAAIAMGLAIAADEARPAKLAERFTRHLGVFREAEEGQRITFDRLIARGTPMPDNGNASLLATRSYRAAHTVGHFRFVECGSVDDRDEPSGDISPHGTVRFPFARSLRHGDLDAAPIARLADEGPLIEERYEVDAAGVVAVTIVDLEDGYSRRYVL